MYTNHLENINFPFEAGTIVTYQAFSWFPVQTLVVTKATFHHPRGGYDARWELECTDTKTGKVEKVYGHVVTPVVE
jgi:hypothetical protein